MHLPDERVTTQRRKEARREPEGEKEGRKEGRKVGGRTREKAREKEQLPREGESARLNTPQNQHYNNHKIGVFNFVIIVSRPQRSRKNMDDLIYKKAPNRKILGKNHQSRWLRRERKRETFWLFVSE